MNQAIVVAPFTFPQFRRQSFARRLLAFFTQEMLKEFPSVKLWVLLKVAHGVTQDILLTGSGSVGLSVL